MYLVITGGGGVANFTFAMPTYEINIPLRL